MKLPRDLSGEALIRHLCKRWEYQRVHQVGRMFFAGFDLLLVGKSGGGCEFRCVASHPSLVR